VRIRGGDFYRDRDRATEPLWQELDRLGIRPGGIDEAAAEPPPADRQNSEVRKEGEKFAYDLPMDGVGIDSEETNAEPVGIPERYQPELIPRTPVAAAFNLCLEEYVAYSGSALPDPRTVNLARVTDGLCAIIEVEGPMIAKRAYDIYLRGYGIRRLGGELRSMMNKALAKAIHHKHVVSGNEPGQSGLIFSTVRSGRSPPVRLRTRGPRLFEDIPPGELRAMGDYLMQQHSLDFGSESHPRAIIEGFDLKRLTTQVATTLMKILENGRSTALHPTAHPESSFARPILRL